jgi:hypothetical protein
MAIGLPFRAGLSRCSTEAKKASMSTHTIIFAMCDYTKILNEETTWTATVFLDNLSKYQENSHQ